MKCEKHDIELLIDRNNDAWCVLCIAEARNRFLLAQVKDEDESK